MRKIFSFMKEVGRSLDDLLSPRTRYIIRLDEKNFNILRGEMRGDFPTSYAHWLRCVFNEEVWASILYRNVYCELNAYSFIAYCNKNERAADMDSLLEYARLSAVEKMSVTPRFPS